MKISLKRSLTSILLAINFPVQTLDSFYCNSSYKIPTFTVLLNQSETYTGPIQGQKIVLYWTKFFNIDDYGVGTGRTPFIKAGCDDGACVTTTDRQWINQSDAILFHARDLDPDDLPPPNWRLPHQLYVFYNYESPVHTDLALLRRFFNDFFNITLTYRRDSDIVSPYGRLKCKSRHHCRDYPLDFNSDDPVDLRPMKRRPKRDWSSKNKTVAWFVSHCETDSRRESLVKQLSKHIQVDVYGKCPGSFKCSEYAKCDKMLDEQYRFYLSFENSLCPDYVTEKLYRALAHNVVPVVLGGADYSKYLPEGSYVDARHFKNASQLARFLKEVASSEETYSSYLSWHELYDVVEHPMDNWCALCRLMTTPDVRKSYPDIAAWWSGSAANRSCFAPDESLAPSGVASLFGPSTTVFSNLINKFQNFVAMQGK